MSARTQTLAILLTFAGFLAGATLRAQNLSYGEFTGQLVQAMNVDDTRKIERLIKKQPGFALVYFERLVLADRLQNQNNREPRTAIKKGFTGAFSDGRAISEVEKWAELVSTEDLKTYNEATDGLNKALNQWYEAEQAGEVTEKQWRELSNGLREIAKAFDATGHKIKAAEAYARSGQARHKIGKDIPLGDLELAAAFLKRFLEYRQAWSLKDDTMYLEFFEFEKAVRTQLEAALAPEDKGESGGGDSGAGASSEMLTGSPSTAQLSFKALRKQETSMGYKAGPRPVEWYGTTVTGEGPTKIWQLANTELYFVRPKINEFGLATKSDGSDAVEVETSNRIKKPYVFELDGRKLAGWFWVGGDQEDVYAMSSNYAPTKDSGAVYFHGATAWETEINGVEFLVTDDNSDFALPPEDPMKAKVDDRHISKEPMEATAIPSFDGMRVDGSDPMPFSNWVKVDDSWVYVKASEDGKSLVWQPADAEKLEPGEIQFTWGGSKKFKPEVLIVRGRGPFQNAVFDLSDGKKHEVPAGDYDLVYGRIVSGKGARAMTCVITAGDLKRIRVQKDKVTSLKLGGPFSVDFERKNNGDDVSIHAASIRIKGENGEIYTHFQGGTVPEVEVLAARDDKGRGARPVGEFQPFEDTEVHRVYANKFVKTLSSEIGYYPIPKDDDDQDAILIVKGGKNSVIALRQKKHPMFGRLEPIWK